MFKGLLLLESLKDEGILDLVKVTKTEVWNVQNAEGGQPERWTAISFEGESDQAGGAPNANLQSWGLLIGEKGNYSSLLALLDNTHSYDNILREEEWCVGFPSFDHYPQCFETIWCNAVDNDEITEAGFTVEPAKTVQAPRIAECSVNLECRLEWRHPLYENSRWHLFAGRVLHLAMDEAVMAPDPVKRMQAMGLMYNVRSTVNPLNGEEYGSNTLGLLSRVEKVFTDEGHPKGWRIQAQG